MDPDVAFGSSLAQGSSRPQVAAQATQTSVSHLQQDSWTPTWPWVLGHPLDIPTVFGGNRSQGHHLKLWL